MCLSECSLHVFIFVLYFDQVSVDLLLKRDLRIARVVQIDKVLLPQENLIEVLLHQGHYFFHGLFILDDATL